MPAKTMDEIASLLEEVKFKRRLFGGVDEDSVWRVLERMQTEYRCVVEATQLGYDALLKERDEIIRKQHTRLLQLQPQKNPTEGGGADD